jgi:hypothetical protein
LELEIIHFQQYHHSINALTRAKTISGVMALRHSIRLCHAHSDSMHGEQKSEMPRERERSHSCSLRLGFFASLR